MNRRDFIRGILAAGVMPGLFAPVLKDRFQWRKSTALYVPAGYDCTDEIIYWDYMPCGGILALVKRQGGLFTKLYSQQDFGEFIRLL